MICFQFSYVYIGSQHPAHSHFHPPLFRIRAFQPKQRVEEMPELSTPWCLSSSEHTAGGLPHSSPHPQSKAPFVPLFFTKCTFCHVLTLSWLRSVCVCMLPARFALSGNQSHSLFAVEGHCSLKVTSKGQQTFGAKLLSPGMKTKIQICCEWPIHPEAEFQQLPSQAIHSMFNPILAKPGENVPLWVTAEGDTTRKTQPPAEEEALDATRTSVAPPPPAEHSRVGSRTGDTGGHGSPVLCWAL